jgi:hypothetical protein
MLPTVSLVHGEADQSFAIHTLEKQKQDIHPPLSTLNILYDSLHPPPDLFSNFIAALGRSSRSHMAGVVELLVAMVLESQLSSGISLCATFLLFVEQEVRYIFPLFYFHILNRRMCKLLAMIPRPSALFSRLTCGEAARSQRLAEEVHLNAHLAELDATPPDESDIYGHGSGKWAREGRGTSSWRVVDLLCEAMSGHLI